MRWFLVFVILFFAVGRFCHKQTRGFTLLKIASDSPVASEEETASWPVEQKAALHAILEQPFFFLSSGGQCYAFVSADGKTVIKFFKHHHIRMWNRLNNLRLPRFLQRPLDKTLEKKKHQSSWIFESCRIAYKNFKERSGLIYLHLHKTNSFKKKVKIIDNLNIAHLIDLDTTDFVLQQRAELSHRTLKRLIQDNRLEEAKQCIDSVLALTIERVKKGIIDRDPNMRTNIGFIGTYAIEIDIGSFTKKIDRIHEDNFQMELFTNTAKFHTWLNKRNTLLADYLTTRIQESFTRR